MKSVTAALPQRSGNRLLIHASAVRIGNVAVTFAASAGEGTSTITAALAARGYPVLTDDMRPVDFSRSQPLAVPALPRLKLSPEAAAGCDPEKLQPLHRWEEKKQAWMARGEDPTLRPPLARINLLQTGNPWSWARQHLWTL